MIHGRISSFVKKVKSKYRAAFKRGEQRPGVQKAKASMKHGARNNINF